MQHRLFIVFILLFCFCFAQSQSDLQKTINTFVKTEGLKNASISINIVDTKTGKTLGKYEPHRSLSPASSIKIITTATALAVLGNDFKFRTSLEYDGQINDNILNGNLYIKGYGDPTLGTDQRSEIPDIESIMNKFTEAVQNQGIKEINGLVVGDGTYFNSQVNAPTIQWNDMGNYYGAGVHGLNIHENLYHLRFIQSTKIGTKPKLKSTDPYIPNLMLVNQIKSAAAGTGDNAYIHGAPFNYYCFIRGTIPVGQGIFSVKGAIPDPPLFAAQYFLKKLDAVGVQTQRLASSQLELLREGTALTQRTSFFSHFSPPLNKIAKIANHKSVNLYCEAMLRAIGANQSEDGSPSAGIEAIYKYWEEKGLSTEGFYLEDGSGLSARNAISAYHFTKILQLATNSKTFEAFYDSLPIAGKSGTVRNLLKGTSAVGKVRAKTGSMRRVRSYTGYAKTNSGKLLAYCIIVNNYDCSTWTLVKNMEKIMLSMTKS